MGTQMMGSHGGGKQQSQFQSLAKQSSVFSLNLDDFLEPAEMEVTSSRSATGVQHQESMVRSSWDLGKLTHDSQPMNGSMTLEDYLAKVGAVADAPTNEFSNAGSSDGIGCQSSGTRDYLQEVHWPQRPQVGVCLGTTEAGQMHGAMEELSDTQAHGLGRVVVRDTAKKTVEGRQKRMIKNRESAARSRARKQAYAQELENKVSQLEEENQKLQKEKEWDDALQNMPEPKPTCKLRRTFSAQF